MGFGKISIIRFYKMVFEIFFIVNMNMILLTGPRSACHSAESLLMNIISVNEHNSLGSPGKILLVSVFSVLILINFI